MSRGEEQKFRQIGEEKSCPVTKAGNTKIEEVNSAISFKESVLGEKARAAADMLRRMGDPYKETEDLVDSVVALKNSVVTGRVC